MPLHATCPFYHILLHSFVIYCIPWLLFSLKHAAQHFNPHTLTQ